MLKNAIRQTARFHVYKEMFFYRVVNGYIKLSVLLLLLATVLYALCGFRSSIFLFLLHLETLQKIFISFFVGLQDSQNYGNS